MSWTPTSSVMLFVLLLVSPFGIADDQGGDSPKGVQKVLENVVEDAEISTESTGSARAGTNRGSRDDVVRNAAKDVASLSAVGGGFLGVRMSEREPFVYLVERVLPGSAASDAGIRAGDVILKLDAKEHSSLGGLVSTIRKGRPGDSLLFEIRRGREVLKTTAILGDLPGKIDKEQRASIEKPNASMDRFERSSEVGSGFLGVRTEPLDPVLTLHLRLGEGVGMLVTEVLEGSPADQSQIQKNDILLEVAGEPVRDCHFLRKHHEGETLPLVLIRRGERVQLSVELSSRPSVLAGIPQVVVPDDGSLKWLRRLQLPSIRGKLYFERDGREEVFEIPEIDLGKSGKDFDRAIEKQLTELKGLPESIRSRVEGMLKTLDQEKTQLFDRLETDDCLLNRMQIEKDFCRKFEEQIKRFDLDWECPFDFQRSSFLMRSKDGDHTITVTCENGTEVITVKGRDGTVIADDITRDKLDVLSENTRKKVREVLKNIDSSKKRKSDQAPFQPKSGARKEKPAIKI